MGNYPQRSAPRQIIIWHVWDGEDMAQSDSFFPTKIKALRHIAKNYDGVRLTLDDGCEDQWTGYEQSTGAEGYDVHLVRERIEITRDGLCRALALIPNR